MCVFSILVILKNSDLDQECSEDRLLAPIDISPAVGVVGIVMLDWSNIGKIHINPASRLLEAHLSKFLDIVYSHSSKELNFGGRVRFVTREIQVDSHMND